MGLVVSEEEMISSSNEIIKNKSWSIIGLIENYHGNSTRCHMHCDIHRDSSKWGSPWTPTIANVRRLFGCHFKDRVFNTRLN